MNDFIWYLSQLFLAQEQMSGQNLNYFRIIHKPGEKYIKVYGYSMGFGKADHARTVEKIKQKYADYRVEWSDEGY